jgi:hypothetical protein
MEELDEQKMIAIILVNSVDKETYFANKGESVCSVRILKASLSSSSDGSLTINWRRANCRQ